MDNAAWILQIYEMTDEAAQRAAAELLSAHRGLAVDMRTCERGTFLTVEFANTDEALSVYELVMMADPNAELVHSTTGPTESDARRWDPSPAT